ncbi:MAG: hypothetical protein ACK4Z5_04110 [Brevundimonas sp.]
MTGIVLFLVGIALLTLIAWRGGGIERLAAALVIVAALVTDVVDGPTAGGVRWGVAVVDLLALMLLFAMANLVDRWWLLSLASLQLLAMLTHLAPLMGSDHLVDTAVSVRIGIWGACILTFGFGLIELEAVKRAKGVLTDGSSTDVQPRR